jgi:PKHD-type hydroxylase
MIVTLESVLTPDEVNRVVTRLQSAEFADGRATAGATAARAKKNLELSGQNELQELSDLIIAALSRNEGFRLYAMPLRILPPIFSKYDVGMYYDEHVDGPLMQGNMLIRTDLSFTIFLSDPKGYDGGELVIESDGVSKPVKLRPGSAVLYPSTTLHKVEELTRGTRLAAIGWVQSLVRDTQKRDLLADLARVSAWARETAPDAKEATLPGKIYSNLVRMWSEL